jgi:hypothetical protein
MRLVISALLLLATAQTASADQFIATFMNPNHPRNLRIEITQFDANGATLDTDRRRLARVGPTQSTWAVILESTAARVCVTLRGSERITGGQALLENGGQQPLQVSSGGRTTCAPGSPFDLDLIIVNFE